MILPRIPEERFCERIRKVEGNCRITHRIEIDPASGAIVTDVWDPQECMVAASHAVGPSVCRGEINLVDGVALGQCLEIGDRTICLGGPLYEQLTPPPFDGHEQRVSRLALAVDVGPPLRRSRLRAWRRGERSLLSGRAALRLRQGSQLRDISAADVAFLSGKRNPLQRQ